MVSRGPSCTATMSAIRPPIAAGPIGRAERPLKVSESTVTSCAATRMETDARSRANAKRRRRFDMACLEDKSCGPEKGRADWYSNSLKHSCGHAYDDHAARKAPEAAPSGVPKPYSLITSLALPAWRRAAQVA